MKLSSISIWVTLLMSLHLISCTPPQQAGTDAERCPELAGMIGDLKRMEVRLRQQSPWEELAPGIDSLLITLTRYQQRTDSSCRFEDQRLFSGYSRFQLAEELSLRLMREAPEQALSRFCQLGAIFGNDPVYAEYFAEKLALIAYHNPGLFAEWYQLHPAERDSLIKHTRWQITDPGRQLRKFAGVGAPEELIARMEKSLPTP